MRLRAADRPGPPAPERSAPAMQSEAAGENVVAYNRLAQAARSRLGMADTVVGPVADHSSVPSAPAARQPRLVAHPVTCPAQARRPEAAAGALQVADCAPALPRS